MVREAEKSRARIYQVPGKFTELTPENNDRPGVINTPPGFSAVLDEDYLMVGNHVDELTRKKIINGEYVDFSKLMPRDRILLEEDNRMEMVNKGGLSYWIPISERESTSVNSFYKWEQAFRVFSNIYMEAYPAKANELVQYNHITHTA